MKKLLLAFALSSVAALPTFAQTEQASVPASFKRTEEYCLVLATSKLMSTKVTITIDYGQETKLFAFKDARVKDETGKVQAFNSVIDALNYMNSQGWEFVNAYTITVSGQNVYHYVMRRRVNAA